MGADTKANTRGGGALERGDSRLFEDGSERGGALGSELVVTETVNKGRSEDGRRVSVSTGADRKANTRERWFERQAAYSSDCSVELRLRPSARAAAPL